MVNAFGFGGINCVALLEQAPNARYAASEQTAYPFCVSAPTPTLLQEYLATLARSLDVGLDVGAAAYTLTATRSVAAYVAGFVARDGHQAHRCIDALRAALREPPAHLTRVGPACLLGPAQLNGVTDGDFTATDVPIECLLTQLERHLHGASVAWTDVFVEDARRIVDVPVMPLYRERYWIVGA